MVPAGEHAPQDPCPLAAGPSRPAELLVPITVSPLAPLGPPYTDASWDRRSQSPRLSSPGTPLVAPGPPGSSQGQKAQATLRRRPHPLCNTSLHLRAPWADQSRRPPLMLPSHSAQRATSLLHREAVVRSRSYLLAPPGLTGPLQ
ncbi:hypothetical protein NDU88_001544 [Pleurodeles waltl]|uniref:Uncharacterized protein n=1 Tax=Pleurodeles waltl TaxID=8319 RepID=A0AAV7V839_PLEWA|nr:hypothetical protein NDU88_001544 [Pleurodeles waltl]